MVFLDKNNKKQSGVVMVIKHFVKYKGVYYAPGEDVPLTAEDEQRIIKEQDVKKEKRVEFERRIADKSRSEERRSINKPISAAKLN